jgi:hypothetical protein
VTHYSEKELSDYREILAGWEEDVAADEEQLREAIKAVVRAESRLEQDRAYVDKLRGQIKEIERLQALEVTA